MKPITSAFGLQPSALVNWLPDMDLNHDKQIQSLLCYRYTIGQTNMDNLGFPFAESRLCRILRRADAPGPARLALSLNHSEPFTF